MTFQDIDRLLFSWGYFLNRAEYQNFKEYLEEMLRRKRVMFIWDNNTIQAVITFFLTDNWETFLHKGLWEIRDDNPEGCQIFIDKMICKQWTLKLRRALQEAIELNFNVSEGHYYHAPLGPHVTIKRRSKHHEHTNLIGC